jgi:hypothetical protein
MAHDTKLTGPSMAERINNRLKPSNDMSTAKTVVHKGTSPQRVIHSIHPCGTQGGGQGQGYRGNEGDE